MTETLSSVTVVTHPLVQHKLSYLRDKDTPTVASGIRIGTPAATMRGFDEEDFREVGQVIASALADGADVAALTARIEELCERRPLYPGFRGYTTYVA